MTILRAFILTGSRYWTDVDAIRSLLTRAREANAIMIHGAHGCPAGDALHAQCPTKSADAIADFLYREMGGRVIRMPAQWDAHPKNAAGMIRNRDMLTVLLALRACGYTVSVESLALSGGKGTFGMCEIARGANVMVRDHGVSTDDS